MLRRPALVLLAALTACTPAPTPPPRGTVVDAAKIAGTIAAASFPNGRAQLARDGTLSAANMGTVVSPATLELTLGTPPDDATLITLPPAPDSGCTFNGAAPDPAVRVSVWDTVALQSAGGDALGTVTEVLADGQPSAGQDVVRVYSDRAASVRGTVACPDRAPLAFDVTLRAGWNAVLRGNGSGVLSTLPPAARSELYGTVATPAVTLSLGGDGLHFPTAEAVTVPATFGQVGGYSGRVHLSTDAPGLSVQPGTVSLPPLVLSGGPAALRAQQITTHLTFTYAPSTNVTRAVTVFVKDDAGREVGRATTSLEVTRPGFALSTRLSEVPLLRASSVQVPVCVSGNGDYSGPVTLSATGLPAGVTVTPVTVQLGAFTCGLVVLTGDATLRGGTHDLTLTADGGGYRARLALTLTTLGPGVTLAVAEPVATLYQGSEAAVTVRVTAAYGFQGATTLTLSGLPDGVSAAPVTVSARGSATATFSVRATAGARLGVFPVTVSGPDVVHGGPDSTMTLRVRPPRVGISDGRLLTATSGGVWQLTGATGTSSTLTRAGVGGSALAVTVPGRAARLVGLAGGVIAVTDGAAPAALRIRDDGTVTALPAPALVPTDDLADGTDTAGRVWFTRTPAGGAPQICTWTPETGEIRVVDDSSVTSTYGARVTLSPDHRTVLVVPRYAGVALTVATGTGAVSTSALAGGFSTAALSSSGDVWFAGYTTLTRVSAAGTAAFTNVPTGELIGFDAAQPTVLWGHDAASVYRIDTATGTSVPIQLSDTSALRAALNPDGGVYVVAYDAGPAGTVRSSLTLVR
ncbi:hypothetical protein HNQ07_000531 [Deinococcus metalli]|uniref:Uncharacterized protein n=1 Tax=Deinococcus metalli TaxID=1141878 RepID=A0A7W8KBA6_9DEIO|nr:hypothetical protein [Deinococcus metalli]MBB5375087.1 hypothetical protein [Deinococcus metalli]GHF31626.1 hypothetical protein GCM10017781_05110 [Deinococcus metalli]